MVSGNWSGLTETCNAQGERLSLEEVSLKRTIIFLSKNMLPSILRAAKAAVVDQNSTVA